LQNFDRENKKYTVVEKGVTGCTIRILLARIRREIWTGLSWLIIGGVKGEVFVDQPNGYTGLHGIKIICVFIPQYDGALVLFVVSPLWKPR
jgi:hypothetical protein